MECLEFKKKHKKYSQFPLTRELSESEEYELFLNHLDSCGECYEWDLNISIEKRGFSSKNFPCVHIAYHVTAGLADNIDPWDDPDIVLVKTSHGYGIPIRDGGSSMIKVENCPWCGIKIK
ncbi:DUF6980 family protein [Teredinibacter turnerae]|uniref:DUF6980 family protein n=1 Tax=Teredinibacter turnerae TaxID=2426 RepID=UPI0009B63260|nr:hypothetical protein [Teredinibacter turnerae]